MARDFTLDEKREMLSELLTSINRDEYLELNASDNEDTMSFLGNVLEDYADRNGIDVSDLV